ncbi:hypothetical protein [Agarivorans sp. 1_MG-2023]|uniref:hypothetical protein n=1 Tax=Agarivorans sp. 1_MG-2023 TaxID=3062634 RepID=UPI0026E13C33|nr:hypothetical protein [Agarivorans sp. 1_MG-2023]MDO6763760.1 hypothetical protein [Agarivorans sp. 1_MG-2023]
MIDKRVSIRNQLRQQWEGRFSDGLLAGYLQGTPSFPYSMDRDHTQADNFRYKQDRRLVLYKLFRLSKRNDWNIFELIEVAFNKLQEQDKYALLVSLDELTSIIRVEYEIDVKNGDVPDITFIKNICTLASFFYNELSSLSLTDLQLDNDYYEFVAKNHAIKSVEKLKLDIGDNINFINRLKE